jgi:plastocyanin
VMWQPNRGSRNLSGALAFAAGVAVALACGNPSGSGNGCAGTGAHSVVNAQDNQTFSPGILTINHGESVCWQNLGSIAHTVTATTVTGATDSSWTIDSVNAQLNPGSLFLRTFSRAGLNYFYKCSIHASMTGQIQVR